MAAPFHSLQQKLEAALKSVAEAVPLADRGSAQVYAGINNDDLPLPRVVVMAEEAEEVPPFSGNHNCQCQVRVLSSADPKNATTEAAHHTRTGHVFDAFYSGTLAVDLTNAVSDFTCFGVYGHRLATPQQEERHWVSSLLFTAYAAPADL